jgi:hypothetical protein
MLFLVVGTGYSGKALGLGVGAGFLGGALIGTAASVATLGVYHRYTNKKENQIFLLYKEILSGAVAKSYMRKGFLIYEEMRKYFSIYEEAVSHI